jgi:hypothetical protein
LFAVSSLEEIAAVAERQVEAALGARNARLNWVPRAAPESGVAGGGWAGRPEPHHHVEKVEPRPGWRRIVVDLGSETPTGTRC